MIINSAEKILNKHAAWMQNKPVKLTIENPDKTATNERHIRVDAKDYWGVYYKFRKQQSKGR